MSLAVAQNSLDSYKRNFTSMGTVDSAGNCTIIYQPAPTGSVLTGTITVYDSLSATQWTVMVNGVPIDVLIGISSCANIQIGQGDILTISTSGLNNYVGTIFHSTYSVVVSPEKNTNLIIPGHDSLPPPISYVRPLTSQTFPSSGTYNFTVPLLPSDNSIILSVPTSSGPSTVTVTGATSGIAYVVSQTIYAGQSLQIPAYGAVDSLLNVQVTTTGTGNQLNVYASPQNVTMGSQTQPLNVLDQNGPFTGVEVTCGPSTQQTLLAAPASGTMNRIRSLLLTSATTTASTTGVVRIQAGGVLLCGAYPQVGGFVVQWTGDVPITVELLIYNGTNAQAQAIGHCFYRNEPI